ncbi:MAG: two-component system sensor histidine kinase/response regulator, partial [Desulforhopalus sp.]
PGMDGIEVTRMLRNEPEFSSKANIPVIAMTACAMAGDKEKCLTTGMNDFIAKPVEMDKLVATLEKYLAKPSELQF